MKTRPLRPPVTGPTPKATPKPLRLKFASLLQQEPPSTAQEPPPQQPIDRTAGPSTRTEQRIPRHDDPQPGFFNASNYSSTYSSDARTNEGEPRPEEGEPRTTVYTPISKYVMAYPLIGYAIAVGGPWAIWTIYHRWYAGEEDVMLLQGRDGRFLDGISTQAHATSGGDRRVEL